MKLKNIFEDKKKKLSGADPKKSPEYYKGLSKKDKEERSMLLPEEVKWLTMTRMPISHLEVMQVKRQNHQSIQLNIKRC